MMASAVNSRTDLLHSIAAAMQNTATNAPSAQNQRCDPEELGKAASSGDNLLVRADSVDSDS